MKTLRRLFLPVVLTLLPAGAVEFRGRLDPAPALGTASYAVAVAAPADLIARLPVAPGPGTKVWMLKGPLPIKGKTYLLAVVATEGGEKTLWIDRDGDGRFGPAEHWTFSADNKEARLTLPWDNGIYREFPLTVRVVDRPPAGGPPMAPTEITALTYNFNVVFGGNVEIDGRPMRLTFAPRPAESAINLLTARISMDANFNGKIEAAIGESENPSGKLPVFRVGSRYLAPKSVDMATGTIVLEERPASDYTRFDAQAGQEMPDFAFVDLAGGRHKLSDYRGKVVLLDFWGTWCGPCIAEMKHLDPIYAQYRPKGFEVIGLNMEKTSGGLTAAEYAADVEKVRAFIAKAGHKWPQATQESIERFALDVIHVNSYPTCILLGPDGRVISREARGKVLSDLLAKHLP
jgi:thiol-disulfide isomerase/thioredoxin